MITNRKRLKSVGMHPGKIREVETWIKENRKVVISREPEGLSIFTIESDAGSLEVLEL